MSGWGLGAEGSFPVTGTLRGVIRIDYQSQGGLLLSHEPQVVALLLPNQNTRVPVQAILRHSIQASLGTLGITPMLKTNVSRGLSVAVGARFGFIIHSGMVKTAQILLPEYPDISVSFVNAQGNFLTDTTLSSLPFVLPFQPSIVAAVQYSIPIGGGKYVLSPEISFQQGLRNLVSGVTWSTALIRAGFSLTLPLSKTIQPPPKDSIQATLPSTIVTVNSTNPDTAAHHKVLRDTIYQRDTTVRLVAWNIPQRITLQQRTLQQDLLYDTSRTTPFIMKEQYLHDLPKTKPVLLPGIEIKFLSVGADKKILEYKQAQRLNVEVIKVRQYYALPYREYYDTTELYHTVRPPSVRFYPKFMSEAGIRAAKAEVFQIHHTGTRSLVQLPLFTEHQKYNDWNTALYNNFPERFILTGQAVEQAAGKQLLTLGCRLFVEDVEGQYLTTDSARIIFEQEVETSSMNGAGAEHTANRQQFILHLTNPAFLPDSLDSGQIRERNRRAYQSLITEITPFISRQNGKPSAPDEWKCTVLSSRNNGIKPAVTLRGQLETMIIELCSLVSTTPVYQALPQDIQGFDVQTGNSIARHFPPPQEAAVTKADKEILQPRIIRIVLERKGSK